MTDLDAAQTAQDDDIHAAATAGGRIAAPLARALAARGYAALTPVQEAVLAPEAMGRDLLVSAQTGSGKTVAFGLAIAPELLADHAPPVGAGAADAPPAGLPRALIVAPTRELALQVRREVEWLYAETGLGVAASVGGVGWRTERRALERGPAIVVGTPGRLRDHLERGTLNLSALRAAVLDEADEMLDLGFAEDLEFILAAAPAGRRTLMFSATVPKAIEALAATYQKDALRIVARGEAPAHADIAYRVLSVGAKDRENAVLNLLRLIEPRAAIVFARTRAGVNHLMARMANRGLSVVALSGELSQTERMHALQALRDGRARVCIATDVAARGIDLPGLELVVHFDLPANPETLLHRSGRTGRAGAKGQAVLIVAPSEQRKAQRLLSAAKVTAEWGRAPSADEVQAADDERLMAHEALAAPVAEEERAMVARLASFGEEALAAAVLRLWRAGRAAPEELHEPAAVEPPRPVRERAEFGPSVWYELSAGHDRRVEARWLLPKLCDAGGITRLAIGAIRVQADRSFVQVAEAAAARLEAGLGEGLALADGLKLTRLAGEPDFTARALRAAPAPGPRRDGPLPRPTDRPQGPTPVPHSRAREEGGPRRAPAAAPGEHAPRGKDGDRPRKPYAARGDEGERPRSTYATRSEGGDRPRKPSGTRDEDGARARKPYAPRGGASDRPRKPQAARAGAGNRTRAPQGAAGGDADRPRKSYGARAKAADRPSGPHGARADADRPRKPPGARSEGGDRPAAAKARWTTEEKRRAAERRAAGEKGEGAPRGKPAPRARPYAPRAPKPPPPDPADPSQSLRKRPGGAARGGAARGPKPGGFKPGGGSPPKRR
jgi:ATP-dependent RNA helicase DeaD